MNRAPQIVAIAIAVLMAVGLVAGPGVAGIIRLAQLDADIEHLQADMRRQE